MVHNIQSLPFSIDFDEKGKVAEYFDLYNKNDQDDQDHQGKTNSFRGISIKPTSFSVPTTKTLATLNLSEQVLTDQLNLKFKYSKNNQNITVWNIDNSKSYINRLKSIMKLVKVIETVQQKPK